MVTTKGHYILASCFLSGAAAIISFISLGTEQWVQADTELPDTVTTTEEHNYVNFGLFGGSFHQEFGYRLDLDLTVVCRFDLNVCALLCGDNKSELLEKIYNNIEPVESDVSGCLGLVLNSNGTYNPSEERVFINSGVWLCSIIFSIISSVMGLFSAALSVWNTAATPQQTYFGIYGIYIYNGIAAFAILLTIVMWGVMFTQDLTESIPIYKIFLEGFKVKDGAQLGYSYWILLVSLFLYMMSTSVLLIRKYLMSKEPKAKVDMVHVEQDADRAIYLY